MFFARIFFRLSFSFIVAFCTLGTAAPALAGGAKKVEAVELELVTQATGDPEASTLLLGLRIRHDPHWHTYWRNPGDSGLPTEIKWQLPPLWQAQAIDWPVPQRIGVGPLANYGYEGELVLPIRIKLPKAAWLSSAPQRISAAVTWLMCKDVCIPGEAQLDLDIRLQSDGRVSAALASASSEQVRELFRRAEAGRPKADSRGQAWSGKFASVEANALILVFGDDLQAQLKDVGALEFFPLEEGILMPSAAQSLIRLPSTELALHIPLQMPPAQKGLPKELNGVIRASLAGSSFHAQLKLAQVEMVPPASGWRALFEVPVSVAKVTVQTATGSGLRSRLTGGSSPALSSSSDVSALTLWTAGAFALLGGLILNLMPCVFPVLSLKVLALAGDANSPRQARRQGLMFSLGVVTSFVLLAILMLLLRNAGQSLGWGFQLQSPWVVSVLCLVFFAIGLNFFGLFEVGLGFTRLSLQGSAASAQQASSAWGAFLSGLLAAVVAAPCSAPFMGSAIGFTLDQPIAVTLLVFGLVGVGMALPYMLLSAFPTLLSRLPRPGAWMETLKHFLAFPMFLTSVWLAWVLGALQGNDAVAWLAVACVLSALVLWQYGRWQQRQMNLKRWAGRVRLCVVVLCAFAVTWIVSVKVANENEIATNSTDLQLNWLPFDSEIAAQHVTQGKTVFVDFTAAWCISCQANKALVFDSRDGRQVLGAQHLVLMRADWTRRDEKITKALASYGRNGVPVYLVLSPGQAPRLLPELLTLEILRTGVGASLK